MEHCFFGLASFEAPSFAPRNSAQVDGFTGNRPKPSTCAPSPQSPQLVHCRPGGSRTVQETKKPSEEDFGMMVELSITKANTVISLETCYLQINRNWFAVIGNLQNTR